MVELNTSTDPAAVVVETNGQPLPAVDHSEPDASEPDSQSRPAISEAPAVRPLYRLGMWEIAASIVAFALWLLLVAAGITVGTQAYIDPIRNLTVTSAWEVVGCMLVIATCHTVTNTAMLCCVSAFLGVVGSQASGSNDAPAEVFHGRRDLYIGAMTRGFFIFLIIQSGSIILSAEAFTNLTLEKYIRLAGLSSLLSFTVGYNPAVFRLLMDRVNINFASGSSGSK